MLQQSVVAVTISHGGCDKLSHQNTNACVHRQSIRLLHCTILRHRRGTLDPSAISTELHCVVYKYTYYLLKRSKSNMDGYASLHSRQLRQIRNSMPTATFQLLVVAMVISRLDYGNGVLIGLPTHLVCHLLLAQNAAARLFFKLQHFDHITDAHVSLHWCASRSTSSLVLADFQGSSWDWIGVSRTCCLCPRQALYSAGTNHLVVPPFKLSTIGTRAFPVLLLLLSTTIQSVSVL